MKEKINEHDMTKKMMEVIRGGYTSKLMTEENATDNNPSVNPTPSPKLEGGDENKVLDIKPKDAVYKDQLGKLQALNSRVTIDFFKIYTDPDNANVHMGVVFLQGAIASGDGSNDADQENWMNKGNRSGVYFELDLLNGYKPPVVKNVSNSDLSQLLDKLEGFYQNWEDEWAKKLVQDNYIEKKD